MTTAIAVRQTTEIATPAAAWTRERIDLVKSTVCPRGFPDDAFALFIEQCKRSGLDPLIKQAFCVARKQNIGSRDHPNWTTKFEFQPAEAGMLGRAEQFPDFRGITSAAVHASDNIEIDPGAGEVRHKFTPGPKRGGVIGAWARLERTGRPAIVTWLDYGAYADDRNPMWKRIGPTMIAKCARVAALRIAYPEAFGGLYIREEMPTDDAPPAHASRAVAPPPPQAAMPPQDDAEDAQFDDLPPMLDDPPAEPAEDPIQVWTERIRGTPDLAGLSEAGKVLTAEYPDKRHPVRVAISPVYLARRASLQREAQS